MLSETPLNCLCGFTAEQIKKNITPESAQSPLCLSPEKLSAHMGTQIGYSSSSDPQNYNEAACHRVTSGTPRANRTYTISVLQTSR